LFLESRDRLKKSITVSAGIIIGGDKVLITRRAAKEMFAGGWEFPGGKLEFEETPQECLIRELKEELNIVVSVGKFCTGVLHDYGDFNVNLIAYYCTIINGELLLSVHDQCEWVAVLDLLKFDFLPADIPIAQKVQEDFDGKHM